MRRVRLLGIFLALTAIVLVVLIAFWTMRATSLEEILPGVWWAIDPAGNVIADSGGGVTTEMVFRKDGRARLVFGEKSYQGRYVITEEGRITIDSSDGLFTFSVKSKSRDHLILENEINRREYELEKITDF